VGLIHVLTMQNHSPYGGEIPDMLYQPKITPDILSKEKEKELYNYLQGLKASDEAMEDMIKEIEKVDTEINILFYGDHFPSIFRGTEDQFTYKELRSEEHTSELQSRFDLVCRLLLEKKKYCSHV